MVRLGILTPESRAASYCGSSEMKMKADKGSPSSGGASSQGPAPFIQALAAANSQYQAYETYLENGMICLKHKIRNIEKRKAKLDDYKERLKREELNQDQLDAVAKYEEVIHNLEFAKELQKTFVALNQELLKAQKKTLRREQLLRTEMEKRRLRTVLHVKYVLENFKQEHVQNDFRDGINGAFIISRKEISLLKDFCKLVCPERDERMSLEDQVELVSNQMWDLLEGTDKIVAGSTYKHLKETISRLLNCTYFDNIPVPHNGLLDDVEDDKIKEVQVTSKALSGKDSESDLHFLCSNDVQPREFLNRQYMNKTDYAVKQPEKPRNWENEYVGRKQEDVPKKWDTDYISRKHEESPPARWDDDYVDKQEESLKKRDTEYINNRKLEEQPKKWDGQYAEVQETKRWESPSVQKESAEPKRILPEPKEKRDRTSKQSEAKQVSKVVQQAAAEFCSTSSLPKDPELRRQKLQDLMSQIQGTCHFIQDSMLDSDSSSPSAIGSQKATISLNAAVPKQQKQQKSETIPSPPKPASELTVHSSVGGSSGSDDQSSLSGSTNDLSGQTPQNSAARNSESEAYIPPSQIYQTSTPITESLTQKSLETSQVTTLPNNQTAVYDAIMVTPQGLGRQTPVFNVNAPLPPRSEQEVKSDAPYSPAFNQSLITASTQTPPQPVSVQSSHAVEQNALTQDSLTEEPTSVANGTPVFLPHSQPNPLPRPNQPYFGSRGAVRGAARSGRGIANAYRGSSNGYKGVQIGFDGYRGIPMPGNGTYGPFPNREYPGMPYAPRESAYQQNYKRGTGVGPRGTMRGAEWKIFQPLAGPNYSTAGWSDSSQMNSPEQDSEHFNSGDSGQGDSRSITPVDVPGTGQAATLLPVHVYPLPQQMRVAFSTARTSNFTPGSLDQPIIFDLLLNNLGETFDFQMGRFTCPVNGTYVFIFHMLKLAVNVPLYVNLMKNDEVLCSAYANDGAPDHETASNHAVLQLFQGDQIWLRLHRGAIYGSSWKYSTFSGYLLYQD
ncbi:caprin-2 isoform X7 [Rhincodon typus]|uniref:caprin-2 isoform X7 n=1 Tax=Rhincodon typus TaxID=259920 RepID=UPI00202FA78F|nr:caprin-2 isoform X7 [Rhincodon typus]